MRVAVEHTAGAAEAFRRAGELSARTIIVDVEPLVANWVTGQDALDRGMAAVLAQAVAVPGVQVVCFATNSRRCPSELPAGGDVQVAYLAAARKPLRVSPYSGFPRPGVVIGDQVATDGVLAWRLGFTFLHYLPPLDGTPVGPRLMYQCGRLVRPLLSSSRRVAGGGGTG